MSNDLGPNRMVEATAFVRKRGSVGLFQTEVFTLSVPKAWAQLPEGTTPKLREEWLKIHGDEWELHHFIRFAWIQQNQE